MDGMFATQNGRNSKWLPVGNDRLRFIFALSTYNIRQSSGYLSIDMYHLMLSRKMVGLSGPLCWSSFSNLVKGR